MIAQKNGSETIFASGPDWADTIDGKFGYKLGFGIGSEGVFGFREGRSATLDGFAVYIPGADARHPKDLELFVGNESATGAFRSLGHDHGGQRQTGRWLARTQTAAHHHEVREDQDRLEPRRQRCLSL